MGYLLSKNWIVNYILKKPLFLNMITTMISKGWINALAALYDMSLQTLYPFRCQQKLTEIQFQWNIEWHSCSLSVSFSVWPVVLLHWTFHCTINHGAPWEMIHFSWDVFEKSISLINWWIFYVERVNSSKTILQGNNCIYTVTLLWLTGHFRTLI